MCYRFGLSAPQYQVIGLTFNRLTVLREFRGQIGDHDVVRLVECRCECGATVIRRKFQVVHGLTTSCGCRKHEASNYTHRQSRTREYKIWCYMRKRCRDPKTINFERYGGRGIQVCERWLVWENFRDDMGPCPSQKHSIDRIDNNGNYEPTNCRWATFKEQAQNRRNRNTNVLITINGETKTRNAWAKTVGISSTAIARRLKQGMDPITAVTMPAMDTARAFREQHRHS